MTTKRGALICALLVAVAATAQAEPLRDAAQPACTSVDGDFATGSPDMSSNCAAPEANGRHDTLEISLTAAPGPAQIGSFLIEDALLYNGRFAPEVLRVDPGDDLVIHLENALGGGVGITTNLHTHGMIVSPGNAPGSQQTPLGDNVFARILAENAPADGTTQHAAMKQGADSVPMPLFHDTADYHIPIPADHPKGLFWYHPHLHGLSGPQVIGGLSGLMTVGSADDFVNLDGADGPISERLLMLKDIQIVRDVGKESWRVDPGYDAGNCGGDAVREPGLCRRDDDHVWLFPVNGQIQPTITVEEGAGQLWRIGNIGANVTYNLEVAMIGSDGSEEILPMQVIADDGASIGRTADDAPIMRDRILVMPSARIEVFVAHPGAAASGRKAVLRTVGFDTGATPGEGDPWPAIDLAEVVFEALGNLPATVPGSALVADSSGAVPLDTPSSGAVDATCPRLKAGAVRIVAFDIPSFPDSQKPGVDYAVPPGCMAGQEYDVIGNTTAIVADDASFAEVLAAYDAAVGEDYATPLNGRPVAYRGKCFDGQVDTCVAYPSVEEWWVVNASDEAHNFHIHQTRFQVLAVRGAGADFTPIPNLYEDNFPVLAGQAIKVRIPFTRPEQTGYFVYHCHILEHEDNGMMAAIEVRDER